MTPYLLLALFFFICMIAAAEMAKRRGLNHRLWFFLAALIGPLALPLLFFRKRVA